MEKRKERRAIAEKNRFMVEILTASAYRKPPGEFCRICRIMSNDRKPGIQHNRRTNETDNGQEKNMDAR